jgi:ribosomal protection tetracycline resistance protein
MCLIYPAFAGSAATGVGVRALTGAIEGLLLGKEPDAAGRVSGRIFKIDRGWGGEKQAVLALTSGTIQLRQMLVLPKAEERVTAIHVYHAGKLESTNSLKAGQIGRISGLGGAVIGDA